MIRQAHRFHGHNALRGVYQRGRVVRSPMLSLKHVANPRRKRYRAAVVVSKKVHKSAVVRNRIRRRVYEQIRLQVPAMTPLDLVFIVYQAEAAGLSTVELQAVVAKLLAGATVPAP